MKKQYVVAFRNTNPRLNQAVHYLANIISGYPYKTKEIATAKLFNTKAEARAVLKGISKDNLYHLEIKIISA